MQIEPENQTSESTSRIDLSGLLRGATYIVSAVLFVAMFVYAATMVNSLFTNRLGAPGIEAALAVAASVGVVFGCLLIALASEKHSVRGLAGLYLFVWLILTLCLVSLEAAVRGGLLSVPDSFASIGRVIAALLAAIALVPAITIPLIARHPDAHPSAAAAIGGYIGFVAKGVAVATSIFASAYFGLSRGMPVEVAVLCGFVIESCFLWSYFSLIKAVQKRDGFDMVLWALAVIAFGIFIALVSVETISTLSRIDVPFLEPLADAGAVLFTSAVGLALALTIIVHVLTNLINVPLRTGRTSIVEGSRLRRFGDRAAALRGDARYALGQVRGEQITAPQEMLGVAKDVPDRLLQARDEARGKAYPKA